MTCGNFNRHSVILDKYAIQEGRIMPKETMTSKERWLAVLKHEKPDRVPMDYWGTPEATAKLIKHLGTADADDAFKTLHIDRPLTVWPSYVGPPVPDGTDMYGCRYRSVNYAGGVYSECVYHPLAGYQTVDEIDANYKWPSADWNDYSGIKKQIEGQETRIIQGGGSEPFLTYAMLRGDEQAYMDLILNPDIVHYCLDKLFGCAYENTARIYEAIPGRVNISYIAEDLGSETGLLMSVAHIKEFLLPRMKRMMDLAHGEGVYVFTHSDGAVRPVLPLLIEAGTDVMNPVQWNCPGMEREGLMRDFGDRLVFHGGVDNQHTLPFGTAEDVRKEVRDNYEIFKGRYILAPCHNIQANTPPENIAAMYDEGYRCGFA
jgi:uroporphyrinogen decarboxylase